MDFIRRRQVRKVVEAAREHGELWSAAYTSASAAKRLDRAYEQVLTGADNGSTFRRFETEAHLGEAALLWQAGAEALMRIDTRSSRELAAVYLRKALTDCTRVEEAWRAEGRAPEVAAHWKERAAMITSMRRQLRA
jgi:hypothetical protein